MLQKLKIDNNTSLLEIKEHTKYLREQKEREKETLKLINEAFKYSHDFVINLFWEEALTYQHMHMNDLSNKKALLDMENSVKTAAIYIKKYKLIHWYSRLYRFLGRIDDYKKNYKSAILNYKKALKHVKNENEPFRSLELEAFMSYSLIMSGKYNEGYKLAKVLHKKFFNSKEGKNLRSNDYQTWAIWLSGLVVRTIQCFLDKKLTFNKKEFDIWLSEVQKLLKPQKDFGYRLSEIEDLKKKLFLFD